MEYEIEDETVLFDASTNPSLARRKRSALSRPSRLASWTRVKPVQTAVVIPEEEQQLA